MNYTFGVNDVNVNMKSASSDVWNHMTKDYCAPSNKISAKTVPLPPPSERAQTIFNNKREAGSLRMKNPACAYNTLGALSTDWPNPMAHNYTAQPVLLQNLILQNVCQLTMTMSRGKDYNNRGGGQCLRIGQYQWPLIPPGPQRYPRRERPVLLERAGAGDI